MSLTPTIGDSAGLQKNITSVRKKILLDHCQHAKPGDTGNFLLVCDMFYIHVGT
jgi:hypothetical protein